LFSLHFLTRTNTFIVGWNFLTQNKQKKKKTEALTEAVEYASRDFTVKSVKASKRGREISGCIRQVAV
jgi:hypothetical protein